MARIRIEYDVPPGMVAWIRERTGWPTPRILRWLRQALQDRATSELDEFTVAFTGGVLDWVRMSEYGERCRYPEAYFDEENEEHGS